MKATTRLALLGLSLALGGCSVLEGDKFDYKSAASAPSLAVPPDLTQLSRDNRYAIPGGPVTASSYQIGQATTSVPVAAKSIGDARIARSGCTAPVSAIFVGWGLSVVHRLKGIAAAVFVTVSVGMYGLVLAHCPAAQWVRLANA